MRVLTDPSGHFSFKEVQGKSFFAKLLPHEIIVQQTLHLESEGKKIILWSFNKGDYDSGTEIGKSPIKISCQISSPPKKTKNIFGICNIDN